MGNTRIWGMVGITVMLAGCGELAMQGSQPQDEPATAVSTSALPLGCRGGIDQGGGGGGADGGTVPDGGGGGGATSADPEDELVKALGFATAGPGGMNYYGGPVMLGTTNVYYIWYGSWSGTTNAILTDLAHSFGGSPYFNINTSFYDSAGRHVARCQSSPYAS